MPARRPTRKYDQPRPEGSYVYNGPQYEVYQDSWGAYRYWNEQRYGVEEKKKDDNMVSKLTRVQ